ncbi:MAG: hypothetical protein MI923_26315 [Phycisphaerales bacterium]|nr:hypothetical protein [Phycisphaerales bacterium]
MLSAVAYVCFFFFRGDTTERSARAFRLFLRVFFGFGILGSGGLTLDVEAPTDLNESCNCPPVFRLVCVRFGMKITILVPSRDRLRSQAYIVHSDNARASPTRTKIDASQVRDDTPTANPLVWESYVISTRRDDDSSGGNVWVATNLFGRRECKDASPLWIKETVTQSGGGSLSERSRRL